MNNNYLDLPEEVGELEGVRGLGGGGGGFGRGRRGGSSSSLPGTFKPRNSGERGGNGGYKRDRESVPTQEQLDKEMEAYNKERQRLKEQMEEG